eukprot:SAG11_NODE_7321_length_1160_cov_2.295005_1_plen_67_part_10
MAFSQAEDVLTAKGGYADLLAHARDQMQDGAVRPVARLLAVARRLSPHAVWAAPAPLPPPHPPPPPP